MRFIKEIGGPSTIGHDKKYITHTLNSEKLSSYSCHFNQSKINLIDQCRVKGKPDSESAYEYSTFALNNDWVKNSYLAINSFLAFPELESYEEEKKPGNILFKVASSCNKDNILCKRTGKFITLDHEIYKVSILPKSKTFYPLHGRLWNIQTDKELIDFRGNKETVSGKHNGYVNTEIISMLVDQTLILGNESVTSK